LRRTGTTLPSRSTASTSISGPPIMKSVCTVETFTPSITPPSTASAYAAPYATWQLAFSSNSVSKNTSPVWPIRDEPSTSATSPR
jgi:hypothetical protein